MDTIRHSSPFVRRFAGGSTKPPPIPPFVQPAQATPRTQCTHMVVNRLHGDFTCDCCHRVSPLGWLYQCSQDSPHNLQPCPPYADVPMASISIAHTVEQQMRQLGVSRSIIDLYKKGHYTSQQVRAIQEQKRKVHDVIEQTVHSAPSRRPSLLLARPPSPPFDLRKTSLSDKSSMAVPHRADLDTTKAATPKVGASRENMPRKRPKPRRNEPCNFKCCHRCRPFLRDRLPMSFEAALYREPPILHHEADQELHIVDASLMKSLDYSSDQTPAEPFWTATLALMPSGSSASDSTSTTSESFEEDKIESSPAISDYAEPSPSAKRSSTGSSVGLPLTPLTDRSSSNAESDGSPSAAHKRRTGSWHFSSLDSVARLDFSTTDDLEADSMVHLRRRRATLDLTELESEGAVSGALEKSVMEDSSSADSSSDGSEEHLQGYGVSDVALTEKPVETGIPDTVVEHAIGGYPRDWLRDADEPAL